MFLYYRSRRLCERVCSQYRSLMCTVIARHKSHCFTHYIIHVYIHTRDCEWPPCAVYEFHCFTINNNNNNIFIRTNPWWVHSIYITIKYVFTTALKSYSVHITCKIAPSSSFDKNWGFSLSCTIDWANLPLHKTSSSAIKLFIILERTELKAFVVIKHISWQLTFV